MHSWKASDASRYAPRFSAAAPRSLAAAAFASAAFASAGGGVASGFVAAGLAAAAGVAGGGGGGGVAADVASPSDTLADPDALQLSSGAGWGQA